MPPLWTCRQLSQPPPSPPDSDGGGRGGKSLGASVGSPMADRIFFVVSSVLVRAMRRSGLLQRGLKRLALLDPFWSKYSKSYLSNQWTVHIEEDGIGQSQGGHAEGAVEGRQRWKALGRN
jgi:hypothetical protein